MTTTSPTSATTAPTPPTPGPPTQGERLRALAGEQLARDRWSRDRLLAYQGEQLAALIAHAVAASPYYRERLGPDATSGEVPLAELPTLSKATLMEHFDRIVNDPRLRRTDLEAHLTGPGAAQPYLGRYRLFSTAGTTGVRGLFVEDVDEFAVWGGTCLRGMASWGLGPATRLAGIGSPSLLHVSNQADAVLLAGQAATAPRLTVTTPVAEMVTALNAFQPEALTAYPSVAAALAEEQLQGRLRIAPGLVATTSEVQTADMRRRMTEAWGVTPLDFYGTTEALIVAAGRPPRPDGHGPAGGPGGGRGRRPARPPGPARGPGPPGPADQPGQPGPAAAPVRADRLGHPGRRAQPARAAVRPPGRGRRAQRRRHHPPGGRRRPGRGAPVPAAGPVLGAAGGPPVPGRPRPGRPAGRGRAARLGTAGNPGPHPGRPCRRTPGRRRGPAPGRGRPRPHHRPRPGHGAKLKLVRTTSPRA